VASLRKATALPLDVHLMIEDPDQFIPAFADAGADWISVHQEVCRHLDRTLHLIKSRGLRAGVVINPATPVKTLTEVLDIVDFVLVMSVNPGFGGQKFIPATLRKVERLVDLRRAARLEFRIEMDGCMALDTIGAAVRAGVVVVVAGNAVFGRGDPAENVRQLMRAAQQATMARA